MTCDLPCAWLGATLTDEFDNDTGGFTSELYQQSSECPPCPGFRVKQHCRAANEGGTHGHSAKL